MTASPLLNTNDLISKLHPAPHISNYTMPITIVREYFGKLLLLEFDDRIITIVRSVHLKEATANSRIV